jgi:hypothetical protein
MIKILSGTAIVIATLIVIILAFGVRKGSGIDTDLVFQIDYSRDYVYSILTDIEKYPERKRNLKNIEVLELSGRSIIKWRENYRGGTWREYELISKRTPNIFDYEIYDSSYGHTAEVTMTLEETDDFTIITMTEKGQIMSTFQRGLRAIRGDNSYLKTEGKWLRVAILDEQIERK